MSWVPIAIAGWAAVAAVVGLFVWGLARAAATGDRDQVEQLDFARAVEADMRAPDRRADEEERRAALRPWAAEAPGRRAEDLLRRDLAEAHRALTDAEARLAEFEARQTA